jgi:hypothetical protein
MMNDMKNRNVNPHRLVAESVLEYIDAETSYRKELTDAQYFQTVARGIFLGMADVVLKSDNRFTLGEKALPEFEKFANGLQRLGRNANPNWETVAQICQTLNESSLVLDNLLDGNNSYTTARYLGTRGPAK